jgi:hypothetical protein
VNEKLQAFLNFVLDKGKSKDSPRGMFDSAEGPFGGWAPELVGWQQGREKYPPLPLYLTTSSLVGFSTPNMFYILFRNREFKF